MSKELRIPDTVEGLREILNTPGLAAEWIQAGRFSQIADAYAEKTRPEFAEQVADQLKAFFEGQNIIEDKTKEAFNQLLREHGVNQSINRPAIPAPGSGAALNASFNPMAPGVKMDDLGFANIGDFARTVWHRNPRPDERLGEVRKVMDAYSAVDPAAGGFLIPETMRSEIMQLALETSIVRSRATVITMSTPTQVMPFVDSTTNVGSVFGGMVFYWTEESSAPTITQAKFGRVKLEANKLMGLAAVPNELWADAPALSSWLRQAMPLGIAFYEDSAFLTGNGAGQPLGVLTSDALVVVDKDTGQEADTITVNNVLNMYSRMLPSSMGRGVWIANQTTFKELMTLSISVGVGGAPVSLVNVNAGPPMTMLGQPLIFTEKVPTLGDQGDICFVDLTYYLIGDRQAVSVETSEHRYFDADQTALKVIERVDGRPWVQSAFTPLNGLTVSPYVALAARA